MNDRTRGFHGNGTKLTKKSSRIAWRAKRSLQAEVKRWRRRIVAFLFSRSNKREITDMRTRMEQTKGLSVWINLSANSLRANTRKHNREYEYDSQKLELRWHHKQASYLAYFLFHCAMLIECWGIEWHLTYVATILKSRVFLLRSKTIKTNFLLR